MNDLLEKIEELFINLGFKKITINEKDFFTYKDSYYKVTNVKDLNAFVIESAESIEDVKKNVFEDSDIYPISMGENLIEKLKEDLVKYYMN